MNDMKDNGDEQGSASELQLKNDSTRILFNKNNAIPKISIIIPVYKAELYLSRCLTSIVQQSFTDWECILVDDGSPDTSGIICDEYAKKDSRFRVIHQKNLGASAARNVGLDTALGEWINFVDSDDWIDSNMYKEILCAASEYKSDIVLFGVWDEYKDRKKTFCPKLSSQKNKIINSFAKYPNYLNYPVNKLYKRSLLQHNNIRFPVGIKTCEDLFFNINAFLYANSIYQLKKSFYHYNRCNESSTMNNYNISYFYDKCWIAEHIALLFEEHNVQKQFFFLIQFYKVYAKLVLILYPNLRDSSLWKKTFPEANKYTLFVPLRFDHKILSFLCSLGLFRLSYFLQDMKKKVL